MKARAKSKFTKEDIIRIIVGERDRLIKCAESYRNDHEDWMYRKCLNKEEAINDLMRILEIE